MLGPAFGDGGIQGCFASSATKAVVTLPASTFLACARSNTNPTRQRGEWCRRDGLTHTLTASSGKCRSWQTKVATSDEYRGKNTGIRERDFRLMRTFIL